MPPSKRDELRGHLQLGASHSSSLPRVAAHGHVEARRWYVLLLYSYISGLQSLLWMTWSSVPSASRTFLNTDDSTLDLFLNEGPIMFCLGVPFAMALFARSDGLRLSILLGASLCFTASVLRCVPLLMSQPGKAQNEERTGLWGRSGLSLRPTWVCYDRWAPTKSHVAECPSHAR